MAVSLTTDFWSALDALGVQRERVLVFDRSRPVPPDQLDYLDLVEPRADKPIMPDGVVEVHGRPRLFFVNECGAYKDTDARGGDLEALRKVLGCRGERIYLARIKPGVVHVVPATLADVSPGWKEFRTGTGAAETFVSRLALGLHDDGTTQHVNYAFNEMFELLNQTADELVQHKIDPVDVLSLVGRALFFRFLADRRIVTSADLPEIHAELKETTHAFATAEFAWATSRWLDDTFNGDLLPLTGRGSRNFFAEIGAKTKNAAFHHLSAIARADVAAAGEAYQLRLQWDGFDFAHVPVGLLSQVYEAFCHKWDPSAKATSVHYTPRHLAHAIVEEVFDGVPNPAGARVLDPACGAGVFLVLALRRLYRERWEADGARPNTKIIRHLLEKQVVGFDISESAIRLAALSLYLTAIELDPKPVPPKGLRFQELRDRSLFLMRSKQDPEFGPVLGSLSPKTSTDFEGAFDIVIGNPPWTKPTGAYKALQNAFTQISRDIITRRSGKTKPSKYQNPGGAPDLPFVWKASEWAKPNGRIALIIHGRFLMEQTSLPSRAREALLRLIEVNGIINGSNLSDTDVWPKMNQPFLMLFAQNHIPTEDHKLQWISISYDQALNRRGEFRIDAEAAEPVSPAATFAEPWLWKALAVGTALDIAVVRKIKAKSAPKLIDYWETNLGLVSCNGYQIKAKQKQQSAAELRGLPNLYSTTQFRFEVDTDQLDSFTRPTAFRPRKRSVYRAPLVLVKESPGDSRESGWALLSLKDLAYDQSFYGYSAAGVKDGELLVRYLQLFAHSSIWQHYALLTATKIGSERRTIYKQVFDECPLVPFDQLTSQQQRRVAALSKQLLSEDRRVFAQIDRFFASLYGLDRLDCEVVRDTLDVVPPYQSARLRAASPPKPAEADRFRHRLETLLRPFFRAVGGESRVALLPPPQDSPIPSYRILLVSRRSRSKLTLDSALWRQIVALATDAGATRIIHVVDGGLVVALLNQYRFWTPSRARLLAASLAREEHLTRSSS
ncbi:MAG: N-6 DNA methylase [Opitutaceae bacterium]|jgi:SAM-dependent methyltransferase